MASRFGAPDTPSVGALIDEIGANMYLVPNFQRSFVWKSEDMRQLVRSLFSDYYVGSLVFWDYPDKELRDTMDCKPLWSFESGAATDDADQTKRSFVVLDGQQRLTAMHYVFFGSAKLLQSEERSPEFPHRFFVDISRLYAEAGDDAGRDAAFVVREESDHDRSVDAAVERRDFHYSESVGHEFPLRLIGTNSEHLWLDSYIRFWKDKKEHGETQAQEHLTDATSYATRADVARSNREGFHPADSNRLEALRNAQNEATERLKVAHRNRIRAEKALKQLEDEHDHLFRVQRQTSNSAKRTANRATLNQLQGKMRDARGRVDELKRAEGEAERVAEDRVAKAKVAERPSKQTPQNDPDSLETQSLTAYNRHDEARKAAEHAEQCVSNAEQFERRILQLRQHSTISRFTIPSDTHELEVGDIFSQINRRGEKLTQFDLFNAQLAVTGLPVGQDAQEMETLLRPEGLWYSASRDILLRMMLVRLNPAVPYELREDRYIELVPKVSRSVLAADAQVQLSAEKMRFKGHWDAVKQAYVAGLTALRDETHYGPGRPSLRRLVPFEGMLTPFCSLLAEAGDSHLLRYRVFQWYWASVLTRRYTSTSGETARIGSHDYQEVSAWLNGTRLDPPSAVESFREACRRGSLLEQERLTRSQYGGVTAGVKSLLLVMEPLSWLNGNLLDAKDIFDTSLFSASTYGDKGDTADIQRSAFVHVLVGADVGELMEGRLPSDYLREIFADQSDEFVRRVLGSHCISDDAYELLMRGTFTVDDIRRFAELREAEFVRQLADRVFSGINLLTD